MIIKVDELSCFMRVALPIDATWPNRFAEVEEIRFSDGTFTIYFVDGGILTGVKPGTEIEIARKEEDDR